jgi:hypothetical protein
VCHTKSLSLTGAQAAVDAFEVDGDGHVHQVRGDDEYKHPGSLGRAYAMCVARSRRKAAARRASSLRDLPLLGDHALEFTKGARKALNKDLLARIRCAASFDLLTDSCPFQGAIAPSTERGFTKTCSSIPTWHHVQDPQVEKCH